MPLKENKLTETEQKLFNFMSLKHSNVDPFDGQKNISDPDELVAYIGLNKSELHEIEDNDVGKRTQWLLFQKHSKTPSFSDGIINVARYLDNNGAILQYYYDVYGGCELTEVFYLSDTGIHSTNNTITKEQRKLICKFLKTRKEVTYNDEPQNLDTELYWGDAKGTELQW